MKKGIIIFIVLFDLFLFILFGGAFYLGAFNSVTFTEKKLDKMQYVYKKHIGSYNKIAETFTELEQDLSQKSIKPDLWVGVFFDDPSKTKEKDLKSNAGAIITDNIQIKEALDINKKIKKDHIDPGTYLSWDFPIISDISYFIGPMKFYPELKQYAQKNELKIKQCIEIYNLKEKKITYLVKK